MVKSFIKMLANEDGASLVEYALIIALVAGLTITGLKQLSTGINTTSKDMTTQLNDAAGQIQSA